jgi:hypothetical protein
MSARSSRRELLVAAVSTALGMPTALGGCGDKGPEADPAKATELAAKLLQNMPAMSSQRACTDADYPGGTVITHRSLRMLAGQPVSPDFRTDPLTAEWINPPALETAAIRPLVDLGASAGAKRRAAGALTTAKFYLVYRVDAVNAPIALQVKHLSIGTVHTRIIRFERDGAPTCVTMIDFQNDKERSDWAIARSDKALIDPEIAKAMRDDLAEQFVKHAPTTKKK